MKRNYWPLLVALALPLALSDCAVKTYPRPVSTKEKLESNLAHSLDNVGAVVHHYCLAAGPGYDISRQMVQVKNYEFYTDPAFRQADRFFRAPEGLPAIHQEKISETAGYTVWFLSWPSLYQPLNPEFAPLYERYPEDHTAYAVYYQSKQPRRGAIVISHGWTGGDVRQSVNVKANRLEYLLTLGYDAALIQEPYHGLRAPKESKFSGEYFLSGEVSRLNEALAQAVMDVRSLAAWLRQDHAVVGIMGGSLGGFVTLATAAAEPRLDFAVAWVPLSSPADIDEDTKVAPYMVKGMKQSGLDRETVRRVFWVSTPANYPPALPKGDILIIAGMGDNFVPPDQPLAVWEAWGQPPIYWFAGGHVFNFEMKQAQQVAADFLKEHLQSKRNLAPP